MTSVPKFRRPLQYSPVNGSVLYGDAAFILRGGERGMTITHLRGASGVRSELIRTACWNSDPKFQGWLGSVTNMLNEAGKLLK